MHLLAVVVSLHIAAGCQTTQPVNSQERVSRPPTAVNSYDRLVPGTTTHRKVIACINEYQGFLFSITPEKSIDRASLSVKPTGHTAGFEDIIVELARVHPVPVDRFPGWHVRAIPPRLRDHDPLDVLVPLDAPKGGMPKRLDAGTDYYFWADMMAAKGTVSGTYSIPIVLESAGKTVGTLNVELTVWPMVLPDQGGAGAVGVVDHVGLFRHHLTGIAGDARSATTWHEQPRAGEYDQVLHTTLRLLQSHRVNPLLMDLVPTIKVSGRGKLDLDWSHYDRVVEPLLNGVSFANRVPLPVWPLPIHAALRPAEGSLLSAPGSQALAMRYVQECADHFREKEWFDRAFALVETSNFDSAESTKSAQAAIELIREAQPDISIAVRGFPQDMRAYGWSEFPVNNVSPADIWIPDAQFYDAHSMSAQRAREKRAWLSIDRPPFGGSVAVHARPADTLVLGWQAGFLGAEHLWLGCVNCWPTAPQVDPEACAKFDESALVFPGASFGLAGPVATLRLKRVRETMQYAAYVKLLSQHGRGHIADTLRASLVEYAGSQAYRTHFADGKPIGWPESQEMFESARQIMGHEMLRSTGVAGEDSSLGPDLLWRSFMTSTRGIRSRLDGTRIRLTGTPLSAKVQVEAWLTMTNQDRARVRADVLLLGAPQLCTAVEMTKPIDLEVGRSQRVGLSMTCEPAWLQSARSTELAIDIVELEKPPRQTPVRLSVIVAEPTTRPLTIDGDLSDWAAAAGNVASDFQLIAGECDDYEDGCARPTLRTFAFTRRDADFLYIGINAEARGESDPGVRRRSVTYDDLIPMDDEDLVEILIDPLNGGTRSPADLYHIAIKRSGVYLIERGISTVPPVGPRRSWQADIEVASRAQSNRWTAEVRIPLASFDRPGSVRGEVWGFNVTHYNAGQQEFSTWSGAVGNAYDPLSLGNLLLP